MRRLLMLALFSLAVVSCVSTDYSRLPRTGFISRYQKNADERVPFVSYWDNFSVEYWDAYVGQRRVIYLAPVTMQFMDKMPSDPKAYEHLQELRDYFDSRLDEAFARKMKEDPNLQIVRKPMPGIPRIEVAILSAQPVNLKENVIEDLADLVMYGGGLLVSLLYNDKDDKGHIAMGARFFDANGRLRGEVADFEYGLVAMESLLIIDVKDFRPYAYQRQTIDHWADEFATLITTPYAKKVHRPRFSLNPF